MTRELIGLFALNGLLLLLGLALLWSLRPRPAIRLLAAGGVAYMLGIALLIVVGTIEIVLGIPVSPGSLLLGCLTVVAVTATVVRVRSRRVQVVGDASTRQHGRGIAVAGLALGLAALAAYFTTLFRATRFMPAHEWDGWWLWTIRAKSLFYSGDLGGADLVLGPEKLSYPPGLSVLYGTAFEAMGGVDTVTLHLQNWFTALGFAAALAYLLVTRVRVWIAVPALLLAVTLPALRDQMPLFHADALLAYEVALAAVLLLSWLETRASWQCVAASTLLAGALLTKRDGLLFVACVLLAAFAASWLQRGWAWPRLVAASASVAGIGAVWWIAEPRLGDTAPSGGASSVLDDPARFAGALRLTIESALDSTTSSSVVVFTLLALALAAAVGSRRIPAFVLVFMGFAFAGVAAVITTEVAFELSREPVASPVDRLVVVPLVTLAAVLPLLLEVAWRGSGEVVRGRVLERASIQLRQLDRARDAGPVRGGDAPA